MPLSKKRDRERKKRERALKREGGTMLLPSATVRRLRRQGLNITRALASLPVTMDDYHALERRLAAKAARVEWQSSGIRILRDQVATLEARIATLPAMEDTEIRAQLLVTQQALAALQVEVSMQRAEAVLEGR